MFIKSTWNNLVDKSVHLFAKYYYVKINNTSQLHGTFKWLNEIYDNNFHNICVKKKKKNVDTEVIYVIFGILQRKLKCLWIPQMTSEKYKIKKTVQIFETKFSSTYLEQKGPQFAYKNWFDENSEFCHSQKLCWIIRIGPSMCMCEIKRMLITNKMLKDIQRCVKKQLSKSNGTNL